MDAPFPLALTTLATVALCAGLLLPSAAQRTPEPEGRTSRLRLTTAFRKLGALFMNQSRDRVVPVTRRPLRAQARVPTWPALLDGAPENATLDDRRTLLRALFAEPPRPETGAVLARVASEEEGELRFSALHALLGGRYPEGRAVFAEALRAGTDAERSIAIDGLARLGARDDLAAAFDDRLEPLAAKAVLAFAESRERRRVHDILNERVDAARRDAILRLLSGILE